MPDGPNLFARLHKWAVRQDENFLTEALAVVLEQMLILAPEVGTRLIKQLTNGFIDVAAADSGTIELRTQIETEHGRPDLEIRAVGRQSCIEVKAESELRTGQLEGYRRFLEASGIEYTQLVLLTRYREKLPAGAARPDLEIRWFELADWLESELHALEASDKVALFLLLQFLGFLRTRGMTLTQVGKYMPEGLRALTNLLNMLFEAVLACKMSAKKSAAWDYIGVTLDGGKYWAGIMFDEPEKLSFGTQRVRINPEAAAQLGVGEVSEATWVPGRYCWWYGVELDTEEVHFYSRSKVSQMEWLEDFLRDCLEKARSIETPDQPPIPDEPEEV